MKIIDINEFNYQDYQGLDIVAFSFAFSGAMGEGGGIYIVERNGQIYHANYCYDDNSINPDHIKVVIPVIEDIDLGVFGNKSNNNRWDSVYLGYGNHLCYVNELSEEFRKIAMQEKYKYPGNLFQDWPGIILGLLRKEEIHLRMGDIWELMELE